MTRNCLVATAARTLKTATMTVVVIGIFCTQARAVNDILAQWTFETSIPATAGPHAAEVGTGSATGFHAGATVYSNPAGNGSAESFSSTVWAVGDYYQFDVSTTGLSDIGVNFTSTSSNTGPKDFKIQYNDGSGYVDANVTYVNLPNVNDGAYLRTWSSTAANYHPIYDRAVDLTSVSALDNKATVSFRLVNTTTDAAGGGTVAAGGTGRVDWVTIYANYVPIVNGDYNNNGTVDAADSVLVTKGVTPLVNEVPGISPGTTDSADNTRWREAFGKTYLVPSAGAGGGDVGLSAGGVPEPTSGVLCLIGLAGLCWRRRRA